jgi:hypothetical protein
MKPLTEYQRKIIHVFAVCGQMSKSEAAGVTGFLPDSLKDTVYKLIRLGFIEKVGTTAARRRPMSVFRWTGKDYGDKPEMPDLSRTLAIRVTTQAMDAMCRVGRV